jgi:hypothetical protein
VDISQHDRSQAVLPPEIQSSHRSLCPHHALYVRPSVYMTEGIYVQNPLESMARWVGFGLSHVEKKRVHVPKAHKRNSTLILVPPKGASVYVGA